MRVIYGVTTAVALGVLALTIFEGPTLGLWLVLIAITVGLWWPWTED